MTTTAPDPETVETPGGSPISASSPAAIKRTPLIIGGAIATAVALVALGVTTLGGDPGLTVQGQEVTNAEETLTAVEADWRKSLADANATVGEDPRCYFQVPAKGTEVDETVLCGPVRHFGADAATVWQQFMVKGSVVEEGKYTFDLQTVTNAGTLAAPAGFDLVRPDGKEAPKDVKLAEPPPPHAEADTVSMEPETTPIDGAVTPDPAKSVVHTPLVSYQITKVGTVKEIGEGTGRQSAPVGQKFLAMTLRASAPSEAQSLELTDGKPEDDVEVNEVTGRVRAGGHAVSLDLPVSGSSSDDEDGEAESAYSGNSTLVVAVPEDATDATLEIEVAGLIQTVSMTTGERTSTNASGYYAGGTSDISISEGLFSERYEKGDFQVTFTEQFDRALRTPFHPKLGWAPEGTTWIILEVDADADQDSIIGYHLDTNWGKDHTLTDADGKIYEDLTDKVVSSYLAFSVPADQTRLSLKIQESGTFNTVNSSWSDDEPASGTFKTAAKTWSLDFS
jgi:hypothetical protein